ncbi:hypothetical protein BHE74_00051779 [Ensete ventricosum]|nr:hypothetical protein GW17_00045593 [Ensete ventricosum]RWW42649.1 hypothetical protein BHE74_00051779 [Ensete ventricosum]RZS22567.1 hypothetical protein BHM03_00055362 [Ensete ventricosum]
MPWASYDPELCTSGTYEPELRLEQIMSPNSSAQPLTNLSRNTRQVQNPSSTARPVQLLSCSAPLASFQISEFPLGWISSRSDQVPEPCSVGSIPELILGRISSRFNQFQSPSRPDQSLSPYSGLVQRHHKPTDEHKTSSPAP